MGLWVFFGCLPVTHTSCSHSRHTHVTLTSRLTGLLVYAVSVRFSDTSAYKFRSLESAKFNITRNSFFGLSPVHLITLLLDKHAAHCSVIFGKIRSQIALLSVGGFTLVSRLQCCTSRSRQDLKVTMSRRRKDRKTKSSTQVETERPKVALTSGQEG